MKKSVQKKKVVIIASEKKIEEMIKLQKIE